MSNRNRNLPETIARRVLAALFCLGLAPLPLQAAAPPAPIAGIVAPNVVVVTPNLVTAGQPTRESLLRLKAEGYAAVISLAPGNTADAVADQAEILKAQGIEFVHVPIPWQTPEASHLAATAAALQRYQGRKVLVHCQMNMRASAVTFLYRAIYAKEDPAAAWADVKKTWTPNGQWAKFVDEQLLANGIAFKAQ
jgi:protein tyrosine phosphatase (PTP) superfamily phosphohydrolase (DUF442 family)